MLSSPHKFKSIFASERSATYKNFQIFQIDFLYHNLRMCSIVGHHGDYILTNYFTGSY